MEKQPVDFGHAGCLTLIQVPPGEWNDKCKSVNEGLGDFTGQRIYYGSHVLIHFLHRHPWLIKDKRLVELGCGVGACGLLASRLGAGRVVMTDGEDSTLAIARENIRLLTQQEQKGDAGEALKRPPNVTVKRLLWGDEDAVDELLREEGGEPFDVVLGGDLMYHMVDVDALVLTATRLLGGKDRVGGPSGIIIMAHVFRTQHLPAQLLRACDVAGLRVYDLPLSDALGGEAGTSVDGTCWPNMRLQVCVPEGPSILKALMLPKTAKLFELYPEEEEEGEGDERVTQARDQESEWSLFSLFRSRASGTHSNSST